MIGRITGNGPDLALIHGWGLGSTVWAPIVETLAQHCRVHLIDLPGYGMPAGRMDKRSTHTHGQKPHEQTLVEQALRRTPFDAPCRASIDPSTAFGSAAKILCDTLPEGCILCGWSLGAMLALQAAALAPQHVSGLILIGSTPSFMQREGWPAAQPPELLDTFASALGHDAAATLQRFIALLNQGDAQARPLARAMTRQLLADPLPDTTTLLSGLNWLREVDLRALIASIATPTLLIHGAHDPLMPLAAGQWLASQLPDARLETFAGAAHAPFLADPERFATLVRNFCHETTAR